MCSWYCNVLPPSLLFVCSDNNGVLRFLQSVVFTLDIVFIFRTAVQTDYEMKEDPWVRWCVRVQYDAITMLTFFLLGQAVALLYMKGWFFFDLLSCPPWGQLVEVRCEHTEERRGPALPHDSPPHSTSSLCHTRTAVSHQLEWCTSVGLHDATGMARNTPGFLTPRTTHRPKSAHPARLACSFEPHASSASSGCAA